MTFPFRAATTSRTQLFYPSGRRFPHHPGEQRTVVSGSGRDRPPPFIASNALPPRTCQRFERQFPGIYSPRIAILFATLPQPGAAANALPFILRDADGALFHFQTLSYTTCHACQPARGRTYSMVLRDVSPKTRPPLTCPTGIFCGPGMACRACFNVTCHNNISTPSPFSAFLMVRDADTLNRPAAWARAPWRAGLLRAAAVCVRPGMSPQRRLTLSPTASLLPCSPACVRHRRAACSFPKHGHSPSRL